jgi:hypothetical protein
MRLSENPVNIMQMSSDCTDLRYATSNHRNRVYVIIITSVCKDLWKSAEIRVTRELNTAKSESGNSTVGSSLPNVQSLVLFLVLTSKTVINNTYVKNWMYSVPCSRPAGIPRTPDSTCAQNNKQQPQDLKTMTKNDGSWHERSVWP